MHTFLRNINVLYTPQTLFQRTPAGFPLKAKQSKSEPGPLTNPPPSPHRRHHQPPMLASLSGLYLYRAKRLNPPPPCLINFPQAHLPPCSYIVVSLLFWAVLQSASQLLTPFLARGIFYPEEGGDMFLQNLTTHVWCHNLEDGILRSWSLTST
jgi:hypothetical protein